MSGTGDNQGNYGNFGGTPSTGGSDGSGGCATGPGVGGDSSMETSPPPMQRTAGSSEPVFPALDPMPSVAGSSGTATDGQGISADWQANLDGMDNLFDSESDARSRAAAFLREARVRAEEAIRSGLDADRATYEAILAARTRLATLQGDLSGCAPVPLTSTGSFTLSGDGRFLACSNTFLLEDRSSWSFSFRPEDLVCHTCIGNRGHPILQSRSGTRSPGVLFVLSDHTFPPCLPVEDTAACIKIMRLEYGSPGEVAKKFAAIFGKAQIPASSVVLMGMPAYLERTGPAAYTKEMAFALSVLTKMNKGLKVGYLPFIFSSGTTSPRLIRDSLDVTAWIRQVAASTDTYLEEAFKEATEIILELGTGRTQGIHSTILELPDAITHNKSTKTWASSGWSGVPTAIGHLDKNRERRIITCISTALNTNLAMGLSTSWLLDREINAGNGIYKRCRFVVAGGAHAGQLGGALVRAGSDTITAMASNWRVTASASNQMVAQLKNILAKSTPETLILWCLDEAVYYSMEDGNIVLPAKDDMAIALHLPGEVKVIGADGLNALITAILPLLRVGGNTPVVLITPYKRWVSSRCCENAGHTTNTATPEWEAALEAKLADLNRSIRTLLFNKGFRNVRVVNPCSFARNLPQHEVWDFDNPTLPATKFFDEVATSLLNNNTPSDGLLANRKRTRGDADQSLPPPTPPPLMGYCGTGRGHQTGRGAARGRGLFPRGGRRPF